MRFTAPAFLVLLPPLLFWVWRARQASGRTETWLRCTMFALAVLALAGLQVSGGSRPLSVMFVADLSGSVTRGDVDMPSTMASLSARMRDTDRTGLIVFGGDAAVERPLGLHAPVTRVTTDIDPGESDIAQALRLARASVAGHEGARVVLMSDGLETRGRALDEALASGSGGLPVDVRPINSNAGVAPLRVLRLSASPAALVGEPVRLVAAVQGRAGQEAELALSVDGTTREVRTLTIPAAGAALVDLSVVHDRAGTFVYRAVARDPADDLAASTSEAGAVIVVSGEARVLYVGGSSPLIPSVLRTAGYRVDETGSASLPPMGAALDRYDSIVLDDVAAAQLRPEQISALTQYVERRAGGLLVLGTPRSLDASSETPLDRLLPVDVRPRKGARGSGAALVVVFDRSGSMDDRIGGATKIELAREAVARVLASVSSSDAVGVIAFNDGAEPVVPLRTGHDSAAVASRLRAVRPAGPTAIAPALRLAAQWLAGLPSGSRRVVLLVSDGRTSQDDAAAALSAVDDRGFEVTTVSLGAGTDRQVLTSLASATGGRSYFPADVRELPSLLAREALRATGGRLVDEPFVVRSAPHPLFGHARHDSMPRLGGYVVTTARPAAQTVLRSHLDDPILSTWRIGLGRVAVYTADLHAPWSADLRRWDGFTALVRQTVRWVSRHLEDEGLHARLVESDDHRARLIVEAPDADGTSSAQLDVRATWQPADGPPTEVALREVEPGRYEAPLPDRPAGPSIVEIHAEGRTGDTPPRRLVRGFFETADREYSRTGVDLDALSALAHASGGRVLSAGDSAFDAPRAVRHRDLGPSLVFLALALFIGERLLPAGRQAVRRWRSRRRPAWVDMNEAA